MWHIETINRSRLDVLLTVNNSEVPRVNELSFGDLEQLVEWSSVALIADSPDGLAGFLIATTAFAANRPPLVDAAKSGDMPVREFDSTDLIRGVVKLKAFDDAYLYVVRPVERGILAHLRETDGGSEPDAARRAGDERHLACQVEVHPLPPSN